MTVTKDVGKRVVVVKLVIELPDDIDLVVNGSYKMVPEENLDSVMRNKDYDDNNGRD